MTLPRLGLQLLGAVVALVPGNALGQTSPGKRSIAEWRTEPPSITAPGRWQRGFVVRGLGLALREQSAQDDGSSERSAQAFVSERALGYLHRDGISARYTDRLGLGWAAGGIAGYAGIDAGLGYRLDLVKDQGPFARLGFRASIEGDPMAFGSLLELPQLQLGYQVLATDLQLELGGRLGYVWLGRHHPLRYRSTLDDSPELGGYFQIRVRPIILALDLTRIVASQSEADLTRIEASVCGYPGAVLICFDVRHTRASFSEALVNSNTAGLAIVLGAPESR